jgi:hypothetical protein
VFANQADAAADIRESISVAYTLDVLAVRGLGLIGLSDSLLRPWVVTAGPKMVVRVLLIDPASPSARLRADEMGEPVAALANGIQVCLDSLRRLTIDAEFSVYLYDELPVWRLIRIDDVLYVSAFAGARGGPEGPVYKLGGGSDGTLVAGFTRAFVDLARRSREVM